MSPHNHITSVAQTDFWLSDGGIMWKYCQGMKRNLSAWCSVGYVSVLWHHVPASDPQYFVILTFYCSAITKMLGHYYCCHLWTFQLIHDDIALPEWLDTAIYMNQNQICMSFEHWSRVNDTDWITCDQTGQSLGYNCCVIFQNSNTNKSCAIIGEVRGYGISSV